MDKRKEKRKENSKPRPRISAAAMVMPEREMPGTMASPWATPMMNAAGKAGVVFRRRKREASRTNAVKMKQNPRYAVLANRDSKKSLNRKPIRAVGREAVSRSSSRRKFSLS